jgi:curli biogenesis system outer membrane secretion channel CsgG
LKNPDTIPHGRQRLVGEGKSHLSRQLQHPGQPADSIGFGHTEPRSAQVVRAFRWDVSGWCGERKLQFLVKGMEQQHSGRYRPGFVFFCYTDRIIGPSPELSLLSFMTISFWRLGALALAAAATAGCATTEQSRTLETPQPTAAARAYQGVRSPISIGKFANRSHFQRGIFSDGADRLGGQAHTILQTHLQQSGRFSVLDRTNLSETQQETALLKQTQNLKGAQFIITGDVTEFGRKETGDRQLFGVLGRGKEQLAYAKVSLNVVRVQTGELAFAAQGAGEYSLSSREVVGFGSSAGYDSTLNGKVLDLAIRDAVDKLVAGIESGAWTPSP